MARKFKVIFLSVILIIALARVAYSAMAVIDQTAIAKMADQISEMKKSVANQVEQIAKLKEQISIFNDVKKLNTELNSAIGAVSTIKLPITSIDKLASQLRKDTSCLFPKIPAYGIDFAELDSSLCNWTAIYAKNFFTSNTNKDFTKLNPTDQLEERRRVTANREAYTSDTVARAMAQGDISQRFAEETGKTADQLQTALDSAEDLQDRAEVQAQIQIAQLRATAQQTQILAQMLKLQASMALTLGVNPEVKPSQEVEDEISEWGDE